MNKTKKTLMILAIIFNFASIGYEIYNIISYFRQSPATRESVAYLVFDIIDIITIIAINVLLILCLEKGGRLFRARYGCYMTAIVLSIVVNLLSLGSILLICTMFVSDWEWVKPNKDDVAWVGENSEVINQTREEKIASLRLKREKGEISEEEFQAELLKLL